MSKSMASVSVESCVLNQQETAKVLRMCVDKFNGKLPRLYEEGFPKKDDLLGGWIRSAVMRWLDQRPSCMTEIENDEDQESLENWPDEEET